MVDFDRLNRMTFLHNNCREGMSPTDHAKSGVSTRLANYNNETFRAHNGAYPDRPYSPHGTYGTGKKY